MFIDRVLSATLQECVITLCPEFPIRKGRLDEKGNNQSTNIDWLMYSQTKNELIFLELKTTDTSFDQGQLEIYRGLVAEINRTGSTAFLLADVEKIQQASPEFGKYQYVLERARLLPTDCKSARIVYLAPATSKPKDWNDEDRTLHWLSFGMLAQDIPPPFADHWKVVRECLIKLDTLNRRIRNGQPEISDLDNYQHKVGFDEICNRCRRDGDSILVGFVGGINALQSTDLQTLQTRNYKWDSVQNSKGTKDYRNWIPGNTFLQCVEQRAIQTAHP